MMYTYSVLDEGLRNELALLLPRPVDSSGEVAESMAGDAADIYLCTVFYLFAKPLSTMAELEKIVALFSRVENWLLLPEVTASLRLATLHTYFGMRWRAAIVLHALGLECKTELTRVLDDPESAIRGNTCFYLAEYPAPFLQEKLIKIALHDSSPSVRTQAVRALSHFRTDAVIDALRIKLEDDETEEGSVVPTPREVAFKILTAWNIT